MQLLLECTFDIILNIVLPDEEHVIMWNAPFY